MAALRAVGPLGLFCVEINAAVDEFCRTVSGLPGYDRPDPIAMAVALDPTIAGRLDPRAVTVGLDAAGRGGTFVDHRLDGATPNAIVATEVDERRFKAMLTAACTP